MVGGFLFKNNDTSGTEPHYAGMTARAVNVYGSMALEFFADRADYENDTPALRLEPESGTDSTNSTLNFLNATKITGVNSISSGAITSSGSITATKLIDADNSSAVLDPSGASVLEGSLLSKGHSSGDNWMPYTDGNFYIRAPNTFFDNNVKTKISFLL